jgi:hypothetical protein
VIVAALAVGAAVGAVALAAWSFGRRHPRRKPAIAVLALSVAMVGPPSWTHTANATERAPGHTLTFSQLSRELAAGARTRHLPAHLDPPLSRASAAKPIISGNGCEVSRKGLMSKPCIYGDERSRTSIVLLGDSHAAAWFPALDLIGKLQHWRLVVMTKAGCPPAEVDIDAWFRHGAPYVECTQWRSNTKAQIAALHPALVLVTTATYLEEPEARPSTGVPTDNGSTWQDGWAAIFSFLRGATRHVIFISDGPTLRVRAPGCVSRHKSDVRRCNTRRSSGIRLPTIRAREMAVARREGVDVIDPVSWFCTRTTCPVIVNHIVLYRDNAHMTPPWSRFIAPLLAHAIVPIVQTSSGA